ncbi:type II toxin-antitoxin system HicB family antitoxin [Castellaniella ginsengisoli]|uniref:Type II toxin-antitoxin system HicB family antitoxin n=1 Tax=Castellaniella ginsengisoli TaxID=546114 RepID=A0AB39DAF3_9BURK
MSVGERHNKLHGRVLLVAPEPEQPSVGLAAVHNREIGLGIAGRGYDLSKINTKAVRLNISLPENLVHCIDAVAKAQHWSCSAFLAKAAEQEDERRSVTPHGYAL